MTSAFHEFKIDLSAHIVVEVTHRIGRGVQIAMGRVLDGDPPLYLYLEPQNSVAFDDEKWAGRYLLIEPRAEGGMLSRISFMEAVKDVSRDLGPSIAVNGHDAVLVKKMADFLIEGLYPTEAITQQ